MYNIPYCIIFDLSIRNSTSVSSILHSIGTINASRVDDTGRAFWVSSFLVASEWRRRGVGRALWERLWGVLQREGWYLGLSTTLDHPVLHFYERYGFHVVGLQSSAEGRKTVWDYNRWQGLLLAKLN